MLLFLACSDFKDESENFGCIFYDCMLYVLQHLLLIYDTQYLSYVASTNEIHMCIQRRVLQSFQKFISLLQNLLKFTLKILVENESLIFLEKIFRFHETKRILEKIRKSKLRKPEPLEPTNLEKLSTN